jgi:hypothetical protein
MLVNTMLVLLLVPIKPFYRNKIRADSILKDSALIGISFFHTIYLALRTVMGDWGISISILFVKLI